MKQPKSLQSKSLQPKLKRRKFWQASCQCNYSGDETLSQETSRNCYHNKKDAKNDLQRLVKLLIANNFSPEDISDKEVILIWVHE